MELKEGGRGHGHSLVSVMLKEVLNKEDMEKTNILESALTVWAKCECEK